MWVVGRGRGSSSRPRFGPPAVRTTRLCRVLHVVAALRVPVPLPVGRQVALTTDPSRHALIALHTVLGTWNQYPYGVHYCGTCDTLYDYWLGGEGCGRVPHATLAAVLHQLVEAVRP